MKLSPMCLFSSLYSSNNLQHYNQVATDRKSERNLIDNSFPSLSLRLVKNEKMKKHLIIYKKRMKELEFWTTISNKLETQKNKCLMLTTPCKKSSFSQNYTIKDKT
jgi:hypothetical protein